MTDQLARVRAVVAKELADVEQAMSPSGVHRYMLRHIVWQQYHAAIMRGYIASLTVIAPPTHAQMEANRMAWEDKRKALTNPHR